MKNKVFRQLSAFLLTLALLMMNLPAAFAADLSIRFAAYNIATGEKVSDVMTWYVKSADAYGNYTTTFSATRSLAAGTEYEVWATVKSGAPYRFLGWKDDLQADNYFSTGMFKRTMGTEDVYYYAMLEPVAQGPTDLSPAEVTGLKDKTYTGKAIKQTPVVKLDGVPLSAGTDYTLSYKNNIGAGTATLVITGTGGYTGTITKAFKISKAANPLAVKGKTATVRFSALQKKDQTLAVTKTIKFTKKGQGTVKYTLTSARLGSRSVKKHFRMDAKSGKLSIRKRLEKGVYKLTVTVKAAGSANYNAAALKGVTFTVKVK